MTAAQSVIQKMKEKTKWRVMAEGKIGCWTLLIWKILKHYTDSGIRNHFTYAIELAVMSLKV